MAGTAPDRFTLTALTMRPDRITPASVARPRVADAMTRSLLAGIARDGDRFCPGWAVWRAFAVPPFRPPTRKASYGLWRRPSVSGSRIRSGCPSSRPARLSVGGLEWTAPAKLEARPLGSQPAWAQFRVTGRTLPHTRAGERSRSTNVAFQCCTTPPIPSWLSSHQ